jgi:hypothetical protein
MWFSTGKPHPLASVPKLEISVTGAAAHNLSDTEVIGDYILYWVGAPMYSRTHEGTLCTIYLVAWKEGWVSEVRLYPTRPRYQPKAKTTFLSFPLSFAPPAQACTARSYQYYQRRSSY